MIFKSEIAFAKSEAGALIKVKEYFEKAMNQESSETIPINYKVFIFCVYLGFTLDKNDFELNVIDEVDFEKTFSIPPVILTRYETDLKELWLCAKYFQDKYNVSEYDLQLVWNQKTPNEDPDLYSEVRYRAVLGARYFVKKIDARIDLSIKQISDDLYEQLNQMLIKIENEKIGQDLLLRKLDSNSED